jgi:succinate dehydrogenase cytochrome b556 subunit
VLQLVRPRPASAVSAWPPHTAHLPVAPGLFTYAWPLNGFASGFHRATGVALIVGFSGVTLGALAAFPRGGFPRAIDSLSRWPRPLVAAAKWCVGFPLMYHWMAGIRHLLWHWGLIGFDMRTSTAASAAIFASCGALATVMSFVRTKRPKN